MKSIKKHIRVFPDFGSSGIWHYPGGMIEYEDLGISLELQKEFEDWIRFYDFECTAKKTFLVLKKKEKVLNRRGIELATKLKKELPKKIIYYWPEWSKGKMAELQEIK